MVGRKIFLVGLLVSFLGCTQPTDLSDVEVQEQALDIEEGLIRALYQVEATHDWKFTDRQIDAIADSLRRHVAELPEMGEIGYQEQALDIGDFSGAFEGVPSVTVTTNGAFGGPGSGTNGGFGSGGGSTSLGAGSSSTVFGSPSTTNTSLNQAVGIVCAEYNNIRVDIGGGSSTTCLPDDETCDDTPSGEVLSVGFGCVSAGSRPTIRWAAGGSGQIFTVNVSYADIQALSNGFQPSESWARSRTWTSSVSGGSVTYGGPPLRADGGLGFLVGFVEVSGGDAVFVAFVL